MLTKILRQCCYQLLKDNRILKLTFAILASYWTADTFYKYLIVKPTYTFNEKREFRAEDFPDITICPDSAFDLNVLKSKGYKAPDTYFKGFFCKTCKFGWGGNRHEHPRNVSEEISSLKGNKDRIIARRNWFRNETSWIIDRNIHFTVIQSLYPDHKCYKVNPPDISELHPVVSLEFTSNSSSMGSFKVFMSDQMTASMFDKHKTIMLGDKITASTHNGIVEYKVKILSEENLEGDPKYPCSDYKIKGEYAICRENEMIKQHSHFLNCTPPWMTENENLWCNGEYELLQGDRLNYIRFLDDIIKSEANSGCLQPCKVNRYLAKQIGVTLKNDTTRGLRIRFEKEVDINVSAWTIDEGALIAKIGGFIGICKNFLWLSTMVISSIGVLVTKLKLKMQCENKFN